MNRGKRILAVLMMMALALSLCACGDTSKKLIGKWETTQDFTSEVISSLGSDYEDLDTKFEVTLVLEFSEDGAYTLYADEESVVAAIEQFFEDVIAYTVEAGYASFEESGMTRTEADEAWQQQYGCTLEESVREEWESSVDTDALADDFVSDTQSEGVFEAKGSKLYMDEEEISSDTYDVFTVEGDTLTIDIPEGAQADEDDVLDYPLTFTKAAE